MAIYLEQRAPLIDIRCTHKASSTRRFFQIRPCNGLDDTGMLPPDDCLAGSYLKPCVLIGSLSPIILVSITTFARDYSRLVPIRIGRKYLIDSILSVSEKLNPIRSRRGIIRAQPSLSQPDLD